MLNIQLGIKNFEIYKLRKPEQILRTDRGFVCHAKNKTPETRANFANRPGFCLPRKKQNSGNQPEFQSSIKKRTVLKLLLRLED